MYYKVTAKKRQPDFALATDDLLHHQLFLEHTQRIHISTRREMHKQNLLSPW